MLNKKLLIWDKSITSQYCAFEFKLLSLWENCHSVSIVIPNTYGHLLEYCKNHTCTFTESICMQFLGWGSAQLIHPNMTHWVCDIYFLLHREDEILV